MIRKKYIVLCLFLMQGFISDGVLAQGAGPDLPEKVIISINKSFFLAGEKILCSVYTRDAWLHKPLSISRVVTIEVLDGSDRPVTRGKYSLNDGKGAAIISLPHSLESGIYTIRAYTNWMRNHKPSLYYHCNITLIDPQRIIYTDPLEPEFPLQINFFPEGGNFVLGLENHLVIKASDSFGRPVSGTGWLITGSGDTLRQLELNHNGYSDLLFSPQKDTTYSFSFHDQIWNLPEAKDKGWVLQVDPLSSSSLPIEIQKSESTEDAATLLRQRRGVLLYRVALPEFDSRYRLEIGATEMNGGVASLQIMDNSGNVLAHRLVQLPEKNRIVVGVGTYLPMLNESKDLQLIELSGRENERDQLNVEKDIEFLPEIRGRMVSGHFVNGDGPSFKDEELILARISGETELSNVSVTDDGRFFLHPKAVTTDQEYVLLQRPYGPL